MTELENLEESICENCEHTCTYYLYVHVKGYIRELYQDERCDKLMELNNTNPKRTEP